MASNDFVRNGLKLAIGLAGVVFVAQAVAEEQYAYNFEGRRDPFVPLITPAGYLINQEPETNAALRVEGIMYDPKGDSMAIINGELVREGETIGDAVVSVIEPNKVTVIKANEKMEIELRKGE